MKQFFIFCILLSCSTLMTAQATDFPQSWEGNWKGEVNIYSPNGSYKVPMSLVVQPIDSVRWSWTLNYEAPNQTPRQYELIKDGLDWKIDEKNGVILPQQFLDNRMSSSFSVGGSLLICYYWIKNEVLNMEIHAVNLEANSKTSTNSEEVFEVGNHSIGSFQQAKLYRK